MADEKKVVIPAKKPKEPGSRTKSNRQEIIRVLGDVSIKDVKNEEEFSACMKLHKLLVGEPKPRNKRTPKGTAPAPTLPVSKPVDVNDL